MLIPAPAARYDLPSVRRVKDPENPNVDLIDPVTPTLPAKLEPDIVATTESSIAKVTSPLPPPPEYCLRNSDDLL